MRLMTDILQKNKTGYEEASVFMEKQPPLFYSSAMETDMRAGC
jgi:hypothetical protein